jgi:hypothetical protein
MLTSSKVSAPTLSRRSSAMREHSSCSASGAPTPNCSRRNSIRCARTRSRINRDIGRGCVAARDTIVSKQRHGLFRHAQGWRLFARKVAATSAVHAAQLRARFYNHPTKGNGCLIALLSHESTALQKMAQQSPISYAAQCLICDISSGEFRCTFTHMLHYLHDSTS